MDRLLTEPGWSGGQQSQDRLRIIKQSQDRPVVNSVRIDQGLTEPGSTVMLV